MIELQSVWGWQPALYLFLGGMGAGAFVMTAILYLRNGAKLRRTLALTTWIAVACLVVGLLCLITELTNPLRGMLLWQSFSNMGSWMTIGAWILVATLVVFGLFALLITPVVDRWASKRWQGFSAGAPKVLRVLAVAGIVLGVGVAAYTGILLMSAPGVPLWNTLLLPCLFTVSGLDTGVALVELVAAGCARREPMAGRDHRLMAIFVVVLVLVESVVLAVFLGGALGAGDPLVPDAAGVVTLSASLLTSGVLAPWFWGLVVVCGLAAPLLASVISLAMTAKASENAPVAEVSAAVFAQGDEVAEAIQAEVDPAALEQAVQKERRSEAIVCIGAAGALIGGCALRFLVVMAGLHADPVAGTVGDLFADLLSRL